jgi:nucleotide-binding universal stress UspA family protein
MKTTETFHRVLIATDGSAGSVAAAEEGVRLAKLLGADVIFVAVAPGPLPILGDRYYQRTLDARYGTMRDALAKATGFAQERRVAFETVLLEGSPAPQILQLARSRSVDLIVVGSRGRGLVKSAVLGSVSAEIVHHSDRPVLVFRRPNDRVSSRGLSRLAG